MVSLSFEPVHRVLCLTFSGVFATEDLDSIDPHLIRFLGTVSPKDRQVRAIFDMTKVEALAVSQPRFVERAGKPAIGDMMRIVVAPPWAAEEFGQSYRRAQSLWPHKQPAIVNSLAEAYAILGIAKARFEAVA